MSNIKAFLQPPVMDKTEEVMISDRFKGEDGKPAPFVIRVIDQETNDKITAACTKRKKVNGQIISELDQSRYSKELILACVVEPDFKNTDICAYYKVVNPLDVPGRMLSVGEYNKLVREVMRLNDIATTDEDIEAIEAEIKN